MGRPRAASGPARTSAAFARVPPARGSSHHAELMPAGLAFRGPRGERVLGWAAAIVGAIGIVSALTPEFANRSDFVRGVLPPGVPGAARNCGARIRTRARMA